MQKFLAFDFGASSGRAILGCIDRGRLGLEEIHRFTNRYVRVTGHFYWDVLRLFDELKQGLKTAVHRGHGDLLGIGLDTWGVDFGLVGADNQLVGNPVAYRDPRTGGMPEHAFTRIPREEIYGLTGIQLLEINTVFQLLCMKENGSPWLVPGARLLFMPDLLNFFLTGEKVSEYSIASTSQLMNIRTGQWEPAIFGRLGLPMEIMAPVVPSGTVLGGLAPEVGDETGLGGVEVIAPACHDTACAVAAVPATGDDWAFVSSGTWSLVGIESEEPIVDEYSLENDFTNEGGCGGRILFMRNAMGLWLLQRCREQWRGQGHEASYERLLAAARDAAPFGSIIDPDDRSFMNPEDMTGAIAEFCRATSQPPPASHGEFVRCILESLALNCRFILERIATASGRRLTRLHIVGGGSRNSLLNQFTADATGLEVVAGPAEAAAAGNVMIQAIARNVLDDISAGRRMIRDTFELKRFSPVGHERWREAGDARKSMFT